VKLGSLAVAAVCAGALAGSAPAQPLSIAAFGDMPYNETLARKFERLIEDVNRAPVKFVLNVGDLRAGEESCSDEDLRMRVERLSRVRHPMIFTPGDNDWTDCHRPEMGAMDSLERLAKLRSMVYPGGANLWRKSLRVRPQSAAYPENTMWSVNRTVFATLHVIGSNNNYGRNPANDAEFAARNTANLAWLREAFAEARQIKARGLLLLLHANMRFEQPLADPSRAGYKEFLEALEDELESFDGHVLLVHGDHHTFRIDKPLFSRKSGARLVKLTRLELFGAKDIHWVRIDIDPRSPEYFVLHPVLVDHR
jgi:hypothetical protein